MSSEHVSHHAHGPDHVPHVSPLSMYLKTFGALVVLTVITVAASYVNLGVTVNLILALIIATIKATVVAAFFMHLYYDLKFHSVVFASSIVFLIIFVAFTMFDTSARGQFDAQKRARPANMTDPFAAATAAPADAAGTAAPAPTAAPTGAQPATP